MPYSLCIDFSASNFITYRFVSSFLCVLFSPFPFQFEFLLRSLTSHIIYTHTLSLSLSLHLSAFHAIDVKFFRVECAMHQISAQRTASKNVQRSRKKNLYKNGNTQTTIEIAGDDFVCIVWNEIVWLLVLLPFYTYTNIRRAPNIRNLIKNNMLTCSDASMVTIETKNSLQRKFFRFKSCQQIANVAWLLFSWIAKYFFHFKRTELSRAGNSLERPLIIATSFCKPSSWVFNSVDRIRHFSHGLFSLWNSSHLAVWPEPNSLH